MALFPMSGVLRGFPSAEYNLYASTKTLVRPCSSEKLLIHELETLPALVTLFVDGDELSVIECSYLAAGINLYSGA
jgi:hypothetical protein